MLGELLAPFEESDVQCATLATPLDPVSDAQLIASPNQVKVVRNLRGDALYFSRAPIPYPRMARPPSILVMWGYMLPASDSGTHERAASQSAGTA